MPVRLEGDGWSVCLDLIGANEGVPLADGDTARFPEVLPGVELQYRQLADGMKETVVLAGPRAPSSYTFAMSLDGLELRCGAEGRWALHRPGSDSPLLLVGDAYAWDSAGCVGAKSTDPHAAMSVTPCSGGALVTIALDQEWLASPARVFPVYLDPSFAGAPDRDTYINSATPTTSYGTSTSMYDGKSGTGYCQSLLHWDTSSIPSISRVDSATLAVWLYSSTATATSYLARVTGNWTEATTWNTSPTANFYSSMTVSGVNKWASWQVTTMTQNWVSGSWANQGARLYHQTNGTQDSVLYKYYSREHTNTAYRPKLTVAYTTVPDPIVYTTKYWSGLDWWRESDANRDGVPDKRNDFPRVGRGRVSIAWQPAARATGYRVLMFDGYAYRQIGCVPGDVTSWTSEACGAYPGDSEIAALPASSTANPFRAVTLATGTPEASFGVGSVGTGVIAGDGRYLYVRPSWSATSGTRWRKVGTGLGGTTQGEDYGLIGPDFAGYPIRSALCLDGFVYNSSPVATSTTSTTIRGTWVGASADATPATFTFSGRPLMDMRTSASVLSTGNATLVTSDGDHVYCISDRSGATPAYGGWNVRVFERDGTWSRDATISGPSFLTNGALCDGEALYLMGTGSLATVAKVRLSDFAHVNRWTTDGTKLGGCYDAVNNAFWVGQLDGSNVYRYRGPGFDLRDNPNPLYRKLGPTSYYDTSVNYSIMVVPYNDWGSPSCLAYQPTLGSRSVSVNDDPRHTEFAVGEAAGHEMSAVLDEGALSLSVTDLEIASWGPKAALARAYDSSTTAPGRFAPGWRFSFESRVDTDGAYRDWIDESGEVHSFIVTAGAVFAPQGFYASLATNASGTTITRKDGSTLLFDTSGRLTREADRDGNAVTYAWGPDKLTITAANNQTIDVSFDASGAVTGAVRATADGTRTVDYSTGTTATVTYFAGTADEYSVEYGYTASRLSALRVPALEACGTPATWRFVYVAAGVSEVRYPGYDTDPANRTAISYSMASRVATVTRTGEVSGTVADVVQRYEWNPTGTLKRYSEPRTSAEGTVYWAYEYAPGNEAVVETSPSGAMVYRTIDVAGNTLFAYDEAGHCTSYVYNAASDCVREVDPRGCVTSRTIDASGHVLVERKRLDESGWACTERTYNTSGAVTSERVQIDGSTWAQTDYSDFGPDGQAGSVTQRDVALAYGEPPQDLTSHTTFDAFGNVSSQVDAAGFTTVEHTYSPVTRLRLLASADASGVVTRHAYDVLGNETDTSRTASGAYCDWARRAWDARGRVTTETYLLDGATVDRTVTHGFDAMGREKSTVDSVAGMTKKRFDARGNAVRVWGPAASAACVDASATRSAFDAYGREVVRLEPGAAASYATTTTYLPSGEVTQRTDPSGRTTRYAYDEAGNVTAEGVSESGSTVVTSTSRYDVGGRLAATTDGAGFTTTYANDLAGRQTSARGGESTPTTNVYNAAGWLLRTSSPDGVVTSSVYDKTGRVTRRTESVSGCADAVTETTYDAAGRVLRESKPDGTVVTCSFDAFGRETGQVHLAGPEAAKSVTSAYDALSRVTESTESVAGVETVVDHAGAGATATVMAQSYSAVDVTATVSGSGDEGCRSAAVGSKHTTLAVTARDDARRPVSVTWSTPSGDRSMSRSFDGSGRMRTQDGLGWGSGGADYSYDAATGRLAAVSYDLSYPGAGTSESYAFGTSGAEAGKLTRANDGADTMGYYYRADGALAGMELSPDSPLPEPAMQISVGVDGRAWGYTEGFTWDWVGYMFDERGRRIGRSRIDYYTNSVVSSATYGWDEADRLTTFTVEASGVTTTVAMSYDGSGQRTRSIASTSGGSIETSYTYEGLTLLALESSSVAGATRIDYLYDEAGRPFALGASIPGTETTYLVGVVTNQRGDVLELVDEAGNAFAAYRYDPWGAPWIDWNDWALSYDDLPVKGCQVRGTSLIDTATANTIAHAQPLRYAGYCFDEVSGLYYCSQRYYDPAVAQFISKDPAKADGEASAYQYCGGDPVGKVDPSGLYTRYGPFTLVFTKTRTGDYRTYSGTNVYVSLKNVNVSPYSVTLIKKMPFGSKLLGEKSGLQGPTFNVWWGVGSGTYKFKYTCLRGYYYLNAQGERCVAAYTFRATVAMGAY